MDKPKGMRRPSYIFEDLSGDFVYCSSWEDEVVFKVFCTDVLEDLPTMILEQMRNHLDNIIKNKK